MASAGGDGGLRVWACVPRAPGAAPDDDLRWTLDAATEGGHSRAAYSVAWAPGGGVLASGGGDDAARVWRVGADGALDLAAEAHPHPTCEVNSVAWHPSDPGLLAAACDDGGVRLWRWAGTGSVRGGGWEGRGAGSPPLPCVVSH